jgi:mono/diheme cytochrome c family protein
MRRAVALACGVLAAAGAVVAAAPTLSARPYSQLAGVPVAESARTNPLAGDPSTLAAGRKLYERHCATCHGATGENGRRGPRLLVPEVQDATDGALFWVITNGNVREGMPVWSKLPEAQRWQISAYLKSLGR